MIGLIATKEGMTRLFQEDGKSLPVSVLKVDTNFISQIKTKQSDGYDSIQLSTKEQKEKNQTKSKIGHFSKNNLSLKKHIKEFRLDESELDGLELGKEFDVNIFEEGQLVDVSGISKGKGFQGVVKRHGFAGVGQATHGQHNRLRAPGSIGAASYPARVFKGMKMAGRMGGEKVKVMNLRVLKVMPEKNLLLVK